MGDECWESKKGALFEAGPQDPYHGLHVPSLPPQKNVEWSLWVFLARARGSHPHSRDGHPCSGGGRGAWLLNGGPIICWAGGIARGRAQLLEGGGFFGRGYKRKF